MFIGSSTRCFQSFETRKNSNKNYGMRSRRIRMLYLWYGCWNLNKNVGMRSRRIRMIDSWYGWCWCCQLRLDSCLHLTSTALMKSYFLLHLFFRPFTWVYATEIKEKNRRIIFASVALSTSFRMMNRMNQIMNQIEWLLWLNYSDGQQSERFQQNFLASSFTHKDDWPFI